MVKKKTTKVDPGHPAKFYAELFNISERRIQQLAKDAIIPKAGRGRYPLLGTVRGYVDYLQLLRVIPDALTPLDEVLDPIQEKAHLDRERRIHQTLVTEVKLGEVLPIELIGFVMAGMGAEIAAILESLPAKIKKLHPKLTASTIHMIKKEIVKARNAAVNVADRVDEFVDEYELKIGKQ